MITAHRTRTLATLLTLALLAQTLPATAGRKVPKKLPDPDGDAGSTNKPVKVYILSGQSNMVGMGDITGGSSRHTAFYLSADSDAPLGVLLSVYKGKYSADTDYDAIEPDLVETNVMGALSKDPKAFATNPGPHTQVARTFVEVKKTGEYSFNVGYGNGSHNSTEISGKEIYRFEAGGQRMNKIVKMKAGKRYPVKITYFGQSQKSVWISRTDIPGTLNTVVKVDKKFPHLLKKDGSWTVRNDVTYKGVISAVGQGPLTVGLQGNTIGPELQFGHIMGYYHDEPVLIIKSSIGNRSMGWDILPPGSERYDYNGKTYAGYKDSPASWPKGTEPKPINWYAGKQYDDYTKSIHDVLNNFGKLFPAYKDQGYEVAGFVWWQGHKDGGEPHASRYEQNLVHLIKTWREEFKAPKAPWVIATIGFGGWDMEGPHVTVANAQLAVSGEKEKYPEFIGNVLTVETRDFWRDVSISPSGQGYHYNRNAETYMLVGDSLGRGMVKLHSTPK
jgi:hypothetical protein